MKNHIIAINRNKVVKTNQNAAKEKNQILQVKVQKAKTLRSDHLMFQIIQPLTYRLIIKMIKLLKRGHNSIHKDLLICPKTKLKRKKRLLNKIMR